MVNAEVYDCSEGLTIVQVVLDMAGSRKTGDADLNPCIPAHPVCPWPREVLHDPKAIRVRSELGVPKTWAAILIRVRKRKFVSYRVLLQKPEGMPDADIVVRLGSQPGSDKIGAEHDEEVRAGGRLFSGAGSRPLRLFLSPARWRQSKCETHGKDGFRRID